MIQDYAALIAEVTARSGVSDVATRAQMYVGMAENALSKRLRVGDMEAEATLTTDEDGRADVPADFLEVRSLRTADQALPQRTLRAVQDGLVCGFAVQGKALVTTEKEVDLELGYYAALPGLEANDTNWLLEQDPEVYLSAVLFQVFIANSNLEGAQAVTGLLTGQIEALNRDDYRRRHAGARVNVGGLMP